ncbi:MAG TPA: LuxR C-terminal-related transcriptional regulator [Candidatus Polarisedimenticolaceae bacterium]|nr:LuxR C-terminal-related transcriptional regulator [Candidatus Polarisedimenticolaceae bacterium]
MAGPFTFPHPIGTILDALVTSPDPVFVTDRSNRIVWWNASAEHLLGFKAHEVLGLPCAAMLQGCDAHGNRYCSDNCPITQLAMRHEPVRNFELTLRAKGDRELDTDVSVLHLAAPPPDLFFLAHIVRPSRRREKRAPERSSEETPPPRPTLLTVRESDDARARKLTAREIEVLGMLAAGNPTAEIASRLSISALTVRNHVQNILDKLELHSKTEAVAFAFQKHLI